MGFSSSWTMGNMLKLVMHLLIGKCTKLAQPNDVKIAIGKMHKTGMSWTNYAFYKLMEYNRVPSKKIAGQIKLSWKNEHARCCDCGLFPLSMFHKKNDRKEGTWTICKTCFDVTNLFAMKKQSTGQKNKSVGCTPVCAPCIDREIIFSATVCAICDWLVVCSQSHKDVTYIDCIDNTIQ